MTTRRGRTKFGTNDGSFAPAGTGNGAGAAARYTDGPTGNYWETNHVPDEAREAWSRAAEAHNRMPRATASWLRDSWSESGVTAGVNAETIARAGIRPPLAAGMRRQLGTPIPSDKPYAGGPFAGAVDHAADGVREGLKDLFQTERVEALDRTMELAGTYDDWSLADGTERAEFEHGLKALREAGPLDRDRLMAAAAPAICPALETRMRSNSHPAIYEYDEWQERLRTMHDGFRAAQLAEGTKDVLGKGTVYVEVTDQIAQRGADMFAEDFERI